MLRIDQSKIPCKRVGGTIPRSTYGRKLPSSWMVKPSIRWLRVYVMQYGNAGTPYVIINGREMFFESEVFEERN